MTPHVRRILGGLVAALLFTTTACGGSSGDGVETGSDADIASMLRLVPAAAPDGLVTVVLHQRGLEIIDPDLPGEPGEEEHERERLIALGGGIGVPISLPPPEILGSQRVLADFENLLFTPSRMTAEITVGDPPYRLIIAIGDDLDAAILDDAAEMDGVERAELADTDIVTWLDDNEMDVGAAAPLGPLPVQAGRVSVPVDGVVVHTSNDATMRNAIGAIVSDGSSLADVDEVRAVADALDDAGVVAAHLLREPITIGADDERFGSAQEERRAEDRHLEPYDVLGIGSAERDGDAELVIVLHHDDDATAESNAELLEATLADGTDRDTGRTWSDLLQDVEVEVDDGLVIVRATAVTPNLWTELLMRRSSLLAID